MAERPRTILVPLDVSKLGAFAVDYAAMLAAATGAHLILFMALGRDERAALEEFAHDEGITVDEAADAYLRRVASEITEDVPVERRYQHSGHPAASIVDFVAEQDVSLVVMASHGRSGVTRWLLGSVATKVLETSPAPVTIVPVRS